MMDSTFWNRENTKYSYVLCRNCVCNVFEVPVDKTHIAKETIMPYWCCRHSKDRTQKKDLATQVLKRNGHKYLENLA